MAAPASLEFSGIRPLGREAFNVWDGTRARCGRRGQENQVDQLDLFLTGAMRARSRGHGCPMVFGAMGELLCAIEKKAKPVNSRGKQPSHFELVFVALAVRVAARRCWAGCRAAG